MTVTDEMVHRMRDALEGIANLSYSEAWAALAAALSASPAGVGVESPPPSTQLGGFHLTEWERKELLQVAAGNTLTYLGHHARGGLRPHEVQKMELWKALSDKLSAPAPQTRASVPAALKGDEQ